MANVIEEKSDQFKNKVKKNEYVIKRKSSLIKDAKHVKHVRHVAFRIGVASIINTVKQLENEEQKNSNVLRTSYRYRKSTYNKQFKRSGKPIQPVQKDEKQSSPITKDKIQNKSYIQEKHKLETENKLNIKPKNKVKDFSETVKAKTNKTYETTILKKAYQEKEKKHAKSNSNKSRNSKATLVDKNPKVAIKQSSLGITENKAKIKATNQANKLGIKAVGNKKTVATTIHVNKAQRSLSATAGNVIKKSIIGWCTKIMANIKVATGAILTKLALVASGLFLVILTLMTIMMVIVGATSQISGFIPITEEVLVTQMHIYLSALDAEMNVRRTDTKDVISLIFMSGMVHPERENDDAIFDAVGIIHNLIHSGNYHNLTQLLESNSTPFIGLDVDDFTTFRQFAFIEFYGTLGDPYRSDNWRDFITSHFGYRSDPFGGDELDFHAGLDIGKAGGTSIIATISGRVQFTGYDVGGYGNWVMIFCNETGKETRYAHLRRIDVRVGQRIERGDIVGLTGTTGGSTGDHLHIVRP